MYQYKRSKPKSAPVKTMGSHHSKPEFGSNTSIRSSQCQAVQGIHEFDAERSDEFWFNRSGYRPAPADNREGVPFRVCPYEPDLKPPGSQSNVDTPHPKAWTSHEILERLAVTRGVTDWASNHRSAIGRPFEYQESGDHPALKLRHAAATHNDEWRRYIQRWVDDVARWKRIKDAIDAMARKREAEREQSTSVTGDPALEQAMDG